VLFYGAIIAELAILVRINAKMHYFEPKIKNISGKAAQPLPQTPPLLGKGDTPFPNPTPVGALSPVIFSQFSHCDYEFFYDKESWVSDE